MGLGLTEILIVILVVLLLFGPTRLSVLGKTLGQTIRNFKQGTSDIEVKGRQLPPDSDHKNKKS